jgi:ABC-type multidrug transport system fused ATPase/permease subunit
MLAYVRRRWAGWLAILVLTLLSTLFGVAGPWPLKLLVDNVLGHKHPPSVLAALPGTSTPTQLLAWVVAFGLGLYAVGSVLNVVLTRLWIVVGQAMVYDLSRDVFERLQRRSIVFHAQHPAGDSIARVTSDTWVVHDVVDTLLFAPLHASVYTVGMLVVMARLDLRLTIVSVAAAPLMSALSVLTGRLLRRVSVMERQVESDLHSHVHQTLAGIHVVQAFRQEARHRDGFNRFATDAVRVRRREVVAKSLSLLCTGLATALGSAAVLWVVLIRCWPTA